MHSKNLVLPLALSTLAFGQLASAQNTPIPFEGPIKYFNLDYATGEITPVNPGVDATVTAAYDNANCFAGFLTTLSDDEEYLDWGVKSTGLTGVITGFSFGYGTSELDPTLGGPGASVGINIWNGTPGFCDPGTQVFSQVFTGLPGGSGGGFGAFAFNVDLTSAAISIPDGEIGWSFFEAGNPGTTGPLLQAVGACPSGTVDAFDVYTQPASAATCAGTFAFSTPNISSFYFSLDEDDGATPAGVTIRNTSNPEEYTALTSPQIGGTYSSTVTPGSAGITIVGIAATAGVTPNFLGSGDILLGLAPFPLLYSGSGTHDFNLPLNASLIGAVVPTQGFALEIDAVGNIGATAYNALDLTIGT